MKGTKSRAALMTTSLSEEEELQLILRHVGVSPAYVLNERIEADV